jgi:hypothetical protein
MWKMNFGVAAIRMYGFELEQMAFLRSAMGRTIVGAFNKKRMDLYFSKGEMPLPRSSAPLPAGHLS